MKLSWLSAVIVAAVVTVPAIGQVSVYIGRTPPPLRYERRGPMPGEGYQWVDGYWGNNGNRYVWVQGRWDRPPYEGAYYTHPHYDHYRQGWKRHEGYWGHEDHRDHNDDQGRGDRGHGDQGHGDHERDHGDNHDHQQ